jgi:pimeloyl-ACP methyl ester carboxylesterase
MAFTPIILVPGFWLGGWAWEDVASALRADGHDVTAITLPGLESADTDRSTITLSDHIDAICEAVTAAGPPIVLAVHSGAGVSGYGASDRVPEKLAAVVYVDSGPGTGALDPDVDGADKPLPSWEELDENLDGLSAEQLETFRQRAVPQPAAVLREGPRLTNDRRLDVPSVVVCTSGRIAQCHLRRSADQPLAHVVTPEGAGRRHRRCCLGRGLTRGSHADGRRSTVGTYLCVGERHTCGTLPPAPGQLIYINF